MAERFAMLELKSLLIRLIKRFKVCPNENTLKHKSRNAVLFSAVDDLRLRFERRN